MAKSLIIVESPAKARTISQFMGEDFLVESSYGHIRDLPTSKLGVDVEHDFEPKYIIPLRSRAAVKKLKESLRKAETIILATDEDREGESIAWHLTQALELGGYGEQKLKPGQSKSGRTTGTGRVRKHILLVERIVFHEITKNAIKEALSNPRQIDMNLVNAQQARRILDRLVGYSLSPFLWKKVYRGLSAGRVQSVAVRLVVEREREIEKFTPEEYWDIRALLQKVTSGQAANVESQEIFISSLVKIGDKILDKFALKSSDDAEKIVSSLQNASWVVDKVEKKSVSKNPPSPFTTSTLQQESFRRLGFSAKQTMMLAQQLYEGIELGGGPQGLITYMRTDSFNLSEESLEQSKSFLEKEFGSKYSLPAPRRFKTKTKGAQEAHEAIRPTDAFRTPESLKPFVDRRQYKLYDLIWRRFIACQMPEAIFDSTSIDIVAVSRDSIQYGFRSSGQILRFDGFLKIYPTKFTELTLPDLNSEEPLELIKLTPNQHFTIPPPRYTEASLVKTLEQYGIGRPSTYAPIISTIQDRGYVERHERRYLKPTEVGFLVNDLLVEHFPEVVDLQFTAKMEGELDEIAEGKMPWQPVIREFYQPFAKRLEKKYEEVKKHEVQETTDEMCEKCGKPMVVKLGRFGKFIACSGFPDCKNTKTLKTQSQTIDMKCPKCIDGDIIIRRTKRRKIFFGCSRYPDCDFASWTDPRKKEDAKTETEPTESQSQE